MPRLRVLITNVTLATRTGTETYVRDLALGLSKRGHLPVVYSPHLGAIAEEIRACTIPVVDDLDRLDSPPDVIHGHHHLTAMTALLRFASVPAVYVFHDALAWQDIPPRFPRIRRYVAVDDTCRDRLAFEYGVPEDRLLVMLNSVDLERFVPRGPLPARPRRALVFSNTASDRTHLPAVREACAQAGIALEAIGAGVGNVAARPEHLLGGYDLVFAKAKSALESLAVGAAVVLCDHRGVGPMVTTQNLDDLRRLNFGLRTLAGPLTADVLAREIRRYDAADAAAVSRRIRASAGLNESIDAWVSLYGKVIDEQSGLADPPDRAAELRAAATYFRRVAPNFQELDLRRAEVGTLRTEVQNSRVAIEQSGAEVERLRAELAGVRPAVHELETIRNTATWRLRNRLLTVPLVGRVSRLLARLAAGRPPR